jgi:hypothetical protein
MSPPLNASPVTLIASALLPEALVHASAAERHIWQAALPSAQSLPAARVIAQSQVVARQVQSPTAWNATHEHALAQAHGWSNPDGLLPLAALAAHQRGLTCPSDQGWAFIDVVHWAIQQGQVHVHAPGQVSPAEDQALREAIAPYAHEDGIALWPHTPGRWLAHARHFKQLPSVSVDQVMGRSAAHWLQTDEVAQQSPAQRVLRRLQNEMQMLLYQHPVNDHRQTTLNSFWWSGTGDWPVQSNNPEVHLHTELQTHMAAQDPQAWGLAWHRLATDVMGPALAAGHALVLCGEQRQIRLSGRHPRWWQRWLSPKPLHQVLA